MQQLTLTFVAALFAANLWHIKGMPRSKRINRNRAMKINKGVFYGSVLIVIIVLSSCSYEMRKGYGCYGSTGISAAKASYKH